MTGIMSRTKEARIEQAPDRYADRTIAGEKPTPGMLGNSGRAAGMPATEARFTSEGNANVPRFSSTAAEETAWLVGHTLLP